MPATAQVLPKLAHMCSSRWLDDYETQSVLPKAATGNPPGAGVEGLEEILFTTKTNWGTAEDGTQLLMGKKTSTAFIDSELWSTEDYMFSFDKATKKRHIKVTVDSPGRS